MPTLDHLRAAMNDVAADTPALSSSELLRAGKRRQTRNRALSGAGVVVAITGIAFAAAQLIGPGSPGPQTAAAPATATTAPGISSAAVVPDTPPVQRFAFGPETKSEKNVFESEITDQQAPGGADKAILSVWRIAGDRKLAAPDGSKVRRLEVAGIKVRVQEEKTANGWIRSYEFLARGNRWVVQADPYTTDDGKPYGPTEDDVRWIIETLSKK
jgi:hypothetical protein